MNNNSKGIFKSTKLGEEGEIKKVQMNIHSSHKIIDTDILVIDPNVEKLFKHKRSKTGENKNIQFSPDIHHHDLNTSTRKCLKNCSEKKIKR